MEWTIYNKEKPQKVGSYLVTYTTVSGRYYVDYDYWTVCDKFKYHPTDVVAWMPFPEPYEAEQTEPQTDCDGCQHYANKHTADAYYECKRSYADCYEPQTEREGE